MSGIGETHTLWEWFVHVTGPIEPCVTREMALVGTLLRGAEMALSGYHDRADMMCHRARARNRSRRASSRALERLGLRGDVSYGAADDPNPRPVDLVVAEHEALAAAAAASRRSRFRVGLATVPTSSDELIAATAALVAEHGAAARAPAGGARGGHRSRGCGAGRRRSPTPPGPGCWTRRCSPRTASGSTTTTSRCCASHDVAVAHNPVSNMILASGVCPVPRLLREGITVGLGVDGPASNDSQDMLETMKTAALLQKVHHLQATALTAREVLHMATIGGARALGLADEIGSLEPGKAADLVLFPEHSPSLANIHDPYQKLVYCASVRDVAQVWVAGEPVVVDGRVQRVDVAGAAAARPGAGREAGDGRGPGLGARAGGRAASGAVSAGRGPGRESAGAGTGCAEQAVRTPLTEGPAMSKAVKLPGPDHPITIAPHPAHVVVTAGGRVVADTRAALALQEANYRAVLYIPRDDVDMSLLDRTDRTTYCPYKGDAAYYSVPAASGPNAVWTYEAPYDAVSPIKDHLAFYPDRVTIEERVGADPEPQHDPGPVGLPRPQHRARERRARSARSGTPAARGRTRRPAARSGRRAGRGCRRGSCPSRTARRAGR